MATLADGAVGGIIGGDGELLVALGGAEAGVEIVVTLVGVLLHLDGFGEHLGVSYHGFEGDTGFGVVAVFELGLSEKESLFDQGNLLEETLVIDGQATRGADGLGCGLESEFGPAAALVGEFLLLFGGNDRSVGRLLLLDGAPGESNGSDGYEGGNDRDRGEDFVSACSSFGTLTLGGVGVPIYDLMLGGLFI